MNKKKWSIKQNLFKKETTGQLESWILCGWSQNTLVFNVVQ